jgi:hypothetical protein
MNISEMNQFKCSFMPPNEMFRLFHYPKDIRPGNNNAVIKLKHFKDAPRIVTEAGIQDMMIPINWSDTKDISKKKTTQYKQLQCYMMNKGTYRLAVVCIGKTHKIENMPHLVLEKDNKSANFDFYIPGDGNYLIKGQRRNDTNKWDSLFEFRLSCLRTMSRVACPYYTQDFYNKSAQLISPKTKYIPPGERLLFKIVAKDIRAAWVSQSKGYKVSLYPDPHAANTWVCNFTPKVGLVRIKYCEENEWIKQKFVEFEATDKILGLAEIEDTVITYTEASSPERVVQPSEYQNVNYSHRKNLLGFIDTLWAGLWEGVLSGLRGLPSLDEVVTTILG